MREASEIIYKSASQRARILTEAWLANHGYCPACCGLLKQTPNNTRANDFICYHCAANFELKSKNGIFSSVVPDGAYRTMVEAIKCDRQPNLVLMSYDLPFRVRELSVIPRRFLVEPIVVKRKPLSVTAQRAGWIGCNLNLGLVPRTARIICVADGIDVPRSLVQAEWKKTAVLDQVAPQARGWLAVILGLVERLGKRTFTLNDVYARESEVSKLFPNNRNIRPKLRQQLQVLRDMQLIDFVGGGNYSVR